MAQKGAQVEGSSLDEPPLINGVQDALLVLAQQDGRVKRHYVGIV